MPNLEGTKDPNAYFYDRITGGCAEEEHQNIFLNLLDNNYMKLFLKTFC